MSAQGTVFVVSGPSGAGKTSLLRAVAGLWEQGFVCVTAEIMKTAPVASDRYPIGQLYRGQPIWKPSPQSDSRRQQ